MLAKIGVFDTNLAKYVRGDRTAHSVLLGSALSWNACEIDRATALCSAAYSSHHTSTKTDRKGEELCIAVEILRSGHHRKPFSLIACLLKQPHHQKYTPYSGKVTPLQKRLHRVAADA
jgi:hypothetical protein